MILGAQLFQYTFLEVLVKSGSFNWVFHFINEAQLSLCSFQIVISLNYSTFIQNINENKLVI